MAVILEKKHLENIKNYKYTACDATVLDGVFDPWWTFVTHRLPMRLAPNMITLMGIIFPIASFIWQCQHDLTA